MIHRRPFQDKAGEDRKTQNVRHFISFSQSHPWMRFLKVLQHTAMLTEFCDLSVVFTFFAIQTCCGCLVFFQERWALSRTKFSLKGHWYWHVGEPNYILGNPIIIPIYLIYFTRDVLISILSILQQMFYLIYFTTDVKIPIYWDCQKGGQGETALSLYSILIIFYSASWTFSFHHQMF